MLDGIVIERDLEKPHADAEAHPSMAPKHIAVVFSGKSAELEWRVDGRRRTKRFVRDDAIINPAGLFVDPRWQADAEVLLVTIDPNRVHHIVEDIGHCGGGLDLTPRFQFQDELLGALVRSLAVEFKQDLPPDRLYAGYSPA